jgi:WD40 repeat protein
LSITIPNQVSGVINFDSKTCNHASLEMDANFQIHCVTQGENMTAHRNYLVLLGLTLGSLALAQGMGFDPKKASEVMELTGPNDDVLDMVFSPDGKRLAVASKEATGRIWDVEQGRIAVQLKGHQYGISGLDFSADGKTIVTMGNDDLLKTWDAASGKENSSFNLKCNNGGNGDVLLLAADRAAVSCAGLKTINLQNGAVVGSFKGTSSSYKLALSGDKKTILGSSGSPEFMLFDPQTQESFRTLKGHDSQGFAVAISADGKVLATGSSDNTARIWNAANGKELFVLKSHDSTVNDVAFSPDGKVLATAGGDKTVKLWDVASGTELRTLEGHKDYVLQLAWSRDGKLLATGDADGVVKLWANK